MLVEKYNLGGKSERVLQEDGQKRHRKREIVTSNTIKGDNCLYNY